MWEYRSDGYIPAALRYYEDELIGTRLSTIYMIASLFQAYFH